MSDTATKIDEAHPDPPLRRLRLNSISNARRTFARVIRLYDRNELSEGKFRAMVYGLSSYLGYLKVERELQDFHERLAAIEETICLAD